MRMGGRCYGLPRSIVLGIDDKVCTYNQSLSLNISRTPSYSQNLLSAGRSIISTGTSTPTSLGHSLWASTISWRRRRRHGKIYRMFLAENCGLSTFLGKLWLQLATNTMRLSSLQLQTEAFEQTALKAAKSPLASSLHAHVVPSDQAGGKRCVEIQEVESSPGGGRRND